MTAPTGTFQAQSFFSQMDLGSPLSIVFWAIALMGYLFPIFIAQYRGLKQTAAIGVLCIFLGWTFVGWVIALMLALWPWANAPQKSDALPDLYAQHARKSDGGSS